MSIRHWQATDIVALSEIMCELKALTVWGLYPQYEYHQEEVAKWLLQMFMDPVNQVFILEENNEIQAVAGVSYSDMMHPPFLRTVQEWALWGKTPKVVSQVWAVAKDWGRSRGALFARRAILDRKNQHYERIKWEKLT